MILSDRENKLALRREHIGITPQPPDSAFSSMAIDLTLHAEIAFWTPQPEQSTVPVTVYPARPGFEAEKLLREHGTTLTMPAEGFVFLRRACRKAAVCSRAWSFSWQSAMFRG